MQDKIQKTVAELIALLASARYVDVEAMTRSIRLTATEIDAAIKGYGRQLIEPPVDAWQFMNIVPVRSSSPQRWSVVMPLWTIEEGRSDLSLECTAIQNGESVVLELDDIHVL